MLPLVACLLHTIWLVFCLPMITWKLTEFGVTGERDEYCKGNSPARLNRRPHAVTKSLWPAAFVFLGLLIFDRVLFFCTFSFVMLVFFPPMVLVAVVVTTVRHFARRENTSVESHAVSPVQVAIGLFVLTDMALTLIDNQLDMRIGAEVVTAVERFHAREGRYPASLEELVPRDLASVPHPRPFAPQSEFEYGPRRVSEPSSHGLLTWSRYMFYRVTYNFEEQRWGTLD